MLPATLSCMFALGVDIGGTSVKVALISAASAGADAGPHAPGTHTGQSMPYDTRDARGIGDAITQAAGACASAATSAGASKATGAASVTVGQAPPGVTAVGICAPGLVDEQTGVIAASMNLPALVGVDLRALVLSSLAAANIRALGRENSADAGQRPEAGVRAAPVIAFLPDAHAAALDFWFSLCAHGPPAAQAPASHLEHFHEPPERLLALSLGTGVGACVIDREAQPTGGSTTRWVPRRLFVTGVSSGHLGQIDVGFDEPDPADPSGRRLLARPVGSDGGTGSLESYIGLAGLRRRYGNDLGAALGTMAIDAAPMRALVRALRVAHAIYRPNAIALLGGVGVALAPRTQAILAAVSAGLTRLARPGWTLTSGVDLFHAARGAARAAAGGIGGEGRQA